MVGVHKAIVKSSFCVQLSVRRRHSGTFSFGGHFLVGVGLLASHAAYGTHTPFELRLKPWLHWQIVVDVQISITRAFLFLQLSSRLKQFGTLSFGLHFDGPF